MPSAWRKTAGMNPATPRSRNTSAAPQYPAAAIAAAPPVNQRPECTHTTAATMRSAAVTAKQAEGEGVTLVHPATRSTSEASSGPAGGRPSPSRRGAR